MMQMLYCLMGILQKQEREPHLSIQQFHGGFPKISKKPQNFPKFLKKKILAGFYRSRKRGTG